MITSPKSLVVLNAIVIAANASKIRKKDAEIFTTKRLLIMEETVSMKPLMFFNLTIKEIENITLKKHCMKKINSIQSHPFSKELSSLYSFLQDYIHIKKIKGEFGSKRVVF